MFGLTVPAFWLSLVRRSLEQSIIFNCSQNVFTKNKARSNAQKSFGLSKFYLQKIKRKTNQQLSNVMKNISKRITKVRGCINASLFRWLTSKLVPVFPQFVMQTQPECLRRWSWDMCAWIFQSDFNLFYFSMNKNRFLSAAYEKVGNLLVNNCVSQEGAHNNHPCRRASHRVPINLLWEEMEGMWHMCTFSGKLGKKRDGLGKSPKALSVVVAGGGKSPEFTQKASGRSSERRPVGLTRSEWSFVGPRTHHHRSESRQWRHPPAKAWSRKRLGGLGWRQPGGGGAEADSSSPVGFRLRPMKNYNGSAIFLPDERKHIHTWKSWEKRIRQNTKLPET